MATATISESHAFAAPPDRAWDVLLDPEAIRAVLPGCEHFDETGPETYRVTLAVDLIAFKATVSGDVHITDRVPHESYRVHVTGQGSLGAVDINCLMRLGPENAGSRLHYDITIEAMGQLGVIGGPILGPAAKLIVGQFMSNMEKQIESRLAADFGSPSPATSGEGAGG
jgi:carbon monoxide dehydrogenase subunit G